MNDLIFGTLPDLPQVATLKRIASALWEQEDVAALWLGGSFARGAADAFSDLDLLSFWPLKVKKHEEQSIGLFLCPPRNKLL